MLSSGSVLPLSPLTLDGTASITASVEESNAPEVDGSVTEKIDGTVRCTGVPGIKRQAGMPCFCCLFFATNVSLS